MKTGRKTLYSTGTACSVLLMIALLAVMTTFVSCGKTEEINVSSEETAVSSQDSASPVDISMSDTEITIGICTVHSVAAKGGEQIRWHSSDESVAKAEPDGKITGIGLGECDITAENEFGKKAVCHVTVKKTAFITVDDGPLSNCGAILRKLKRLDVKATFFVVNTYNIAYVKDMHDDGHCVGLHTYSHKFSECYRSDFSYFSDLEKLNDVIEQYTGQRTNILRFPGGTSNRVMSRLGMRRMVSGLDDLGYRAFDWTASTMDAAVVDITSEQAAMYALRDCIHDVDIILMHDKETTPNAIEIIVDRLSDRGYVFDTLDYYAGWSQRVPTWYETTVGIGTVPCVALSLSEKSLHISSSGSFMLSVEIVPDNATDYVRFYSDDPSVAEVSLEGEITGIRHGNTVIHAVASSGKTSSCRVAVD